MRLSPLKKLKLDYKEQEDQRLPSDSMQGQPEPDVSPDLVYTCPHSGKKFYRYKTSLPREWWDNLPKTTPNPAYGSCLLDEFLFYRHSLPTPQERITRK